MGVKLYRVRCLTCPWFQTFERKHVADALEWEHQQLGHKTEREEIEDQPPKPPSSARMKNILRGMP